MKLKEKFDRIARVTSMKTLRRKSVLNKGNQQNIL